MALQDSIVIYCGFGSLSRFVAGAVPKKRIKILSEAEINELYSTPISNQQDLCFFLYQITHISTSTSAHGFPNR